MVPGCVHIHHDCRERGNGIYTVLPGHVNWTNFCYPWLINLRNNSATHLQVMFGVWDVDFRLHLVLDGGLPVVATRSVLHLLVKDTLWATATQPATRRTHRT